MAQGGLSAATRPSMRERAFTKKSGGRGDTWRGQADNIGIDIDQRPPAAAGMSCTVEDVAQRQIALRHVSVSR